MRWAEIVNETSTAGATCASNVAAGSYNGFDPNGQWRSIYPTKKKGKKASKTLLLRR